MNSIHVITVKNNKTGRKTIDSIRATLQKQRKTNPNLRYKVQVYGRGHRYGKGRIRGSYVNGQFIATNWDNRYQSSLPHGLAQRLAVYVSADYGF
jgi:hypothetical protein